MWQDTVMTDEQIISLLSQDCYPPPKHWDEIDLTMKAQAEITWPVAFKAGGEAERKKLLEEDELFYCEEHKLYHGAICPDCFEKRGIMKVVEWLDVFERDCYCGISNHIPYEDWQAKLKEWGI